jgi:amphi-Trp domain-containing protein
MAKTARKPTMAVVETHAARPEKSRSKSEEAEDTKLGFDGTLSLEEAVAYFEAVVSGLRNGKLRFRRAQESISLEPAANVEVEVKASRKGRKEKVSFELSWSKSSDKDLEIS